MQAFQVQRFACCPPLSPFPAPFRPPCLHLPTHHFAVVVSVLALPSWPASLGTQREGKQARHNITLCLNSAVCNLHWSRPDRLFHSFVGLFLFCRQCYYSHLDQNGPWYGGEFWLVRSPYLCLDFPLMNLHCWPFLCGGGGRHMLFRPRFFFQHISHPKYQQYKTTIAGIYELGVVGERGRSKLRC